MRVGKTYMVVIRKIREEIVFVTIPNDASAGLGIMDYADHEEVASAREYEEKEYFVQMGNSQEIKEFDKFIDYQGITAKEGD